MLGIQAAIQEMSAKSHLSNLAQLVSGLLITGERPFPEAKREAALKAANDLLDFAERHAGKSESDFELSCTTPEQIPPVRELIALIAKRKPVPDEQALMAQKFFYGISRGFSIRLRRRGGCVNGLPPVGGGT